MALPLKTRVYAKCWAALLLWTSAGFGGAEITPTERQQLWLRVEPVLRAQLAQPVRRPFIEAAWQVPARLAEQVSAYDALAAAGWVERVAINVPAPVVIKGAVVQRTEPGWRYHWTPQGQAALSGGGLPWAEVQLARLDSITCADRDCVQMNVQFHWRTGRMEPWALASYFRAWPGQNALLAAQSNEQQGRATLLWVAGSVNDERNPAPYWVLTNVELWAP